MNNMQGIVNIYIYIYVFLETEITYTLDIIDRLLRIYIKYVYSAIFVSSDVTRLWFNDDLIK